MCYNVSTHSEAPEKHVKETRFYQQKHLTIKTRVASNPPSCSRTKLDNHHLCSIKVSRLAKESLHQASSGSYRHVQNFLTKFHYYPTKNIGIDLPFQEMMDVGTRSNRREMHKFEGVLWETDLHFAVWVIFFYKT